MQVRRAAGGVARRQCNTHFCTNTSHHIFLRQAIHSIATTGLNAQRVRRSRVVEAYRPSRNMPCRRVHTRIQPSVYGRYITTHTHSHDRPHTTSHRRPVVAQSRPHRPQTYPAPQSQVHSVTDPPHPSPPLVALHHPRLSKLSMYPPIPVGARGAWAHPLWSVIYVRIWGHAR